MRTNDMSTFNQDHIVRTYEDGVCTKVAQYLTDQPPMPDENGIDWNIKSYVVNPTGNGQECDYRVTYTDYSGCISYIERDVDENGHPGMIDFVYDKNSPDPSNAPFLRIDQSSLPERDRGYGRAVFLDPVYGVRPGGEIVMQGTLSSNVEQYEIKSVDQVADGYWPTDYNPGIGMGDIASNVWQGVSQEDQVPPEQMESYTGVVETVQRELPVSSYDHINQGQYHDYDVAWNRMIGMRVEETEGNAPNIVTSAVSLDPATEDINRNSHAGIMESFGFDRETCLSDFGALINKTIESGMEVPSINPGERIYILLDKNENPICEVSYLVPRGNQIYNFFVKDGSGKVVADFRSNSSGLIMSSLSNNRTGAIDYNEDNKKIDFVASSPDPDRKESLEFRGTMRDGIIRLSMTTGFYKMENGKDFEWAPQQVGSVDVSTLPGVPSDKLSIMEGENGEKSIEFKEGTISLATWEKVDIAFQAKTDGEKIVPTHAEFTPTDKESTSGAVSKDFKDGECVRENHYASNQVTSPDEKGIDTNLKYSLLEPTNSGEGCDRKVYFQEGRVCMVEHNVDRFGVPKEIDVTPYKTDYDGETPFVRVIEHGMQMDGQRMIPVDGIGQVPKGYVVMEGKMESDSDGYEIKEYSLTEVGENQKYHPDDIDKNTSIDMDQIEATEEFRDMDNDGELGEEIDDSNLAEESGAIDVSSETQAGSDVQVEPGDSRDDSSNDVEKKEDSQDQSSDEKIEAGKTDRQQGAKADNDSTDKADQSERADAASDDSEEAKTEDSKSDKTDEIKNAIETMFTDKLTTVRGDDMPIFDTDGKGGTVTYVVNDEGKTETRTGKEEDICEGRIHLTEDMFPVQLPDGMGYTGRGGVFVDVIHPDDTVQTCYANEDGRIMYYLDENGEPQAGGVGAETIGELYKIIYGETGENVDKEVHDFAIETESVKMLHVDGNGLGTMDIQDITQDPADNGMSCGTPLEAIARKLMLDQETGSDAPIDSMVMKKDVTSLKDILEIVSPHNKDLISSAFDKIESFVGGRDFLDSTVLREERREMIWDLDKPAPAGMSEREPITKEENDALRSALNDLALYSRCSMEGKANFPTERVEAAVGYSRSATVINNFKDTFKTFLDVRVSSLVESYKGNPDKIIAEVGKGVDTRLSGQIGALIDVAGKIFSSADTARDTIREAVGKDFCRSAYVPGVCTPESSTYKSETLGHSLLDSYVPGNTESDVERINEAHDAVVEFRTAVSEAISEYDEKGFKGGSLMEQFDGFVKDLKGMGFAIEDGAIVTDFGVDKNANIHIFMDDAPDAVNRLRDIGDNCNTNKYIIAPEDNHIPGMGDGKYFGSDEFRRVHDLIEDAIGDKNDNEYSRITCFAAEDKILKEAAPEGRAFSDKEMVMDLYTIHADNSGFNEYTSIDSKVEDMIEQRLSDTEAHKGVDTGTDRGTDQGTDKNAEKSDPVDKGKENSQQPKDEKAHNLYQKGRSLLWRADLTGVERNKNIDKLEAHLEKRNALINRSTFQPYYRGDTFYAFHEWRATHYAKKEGILIVGNSSKIPTKFDTYQSFSKFYNTNILDSLIIRGFDAVIGGIKSKEVAYNRYHDVYARKEDGTLRIDKETGKPIIEAKILDPKQREVLGLPKLGADGRPINCLGIPYHERTASDRAETANDERSRYDVEPRVKESGGNHAFAKIAIATAAIAAALGFLGGKAAATDTGMEKAQKMEATMERDGNDQEKHKEETKIERPEDKTDAPHDTADAADVPDDLDAEDQEKSPVSEDAPHEAADLDQEKESVDHDKNSDQADQGDADNAQDHDKDNTDNIDKNAEDDVDQKEESDQEEDQIEKEPDEADAPEKDTDQVDEEEDPADADTVDDDKDLDDEDKEEELNADDEEDRTDGKESDDTEEEAIDASDEDPSDKTDQDADEEDDADQKENPADQEEAADQDEDQAEHDTDKTEDEETVDAEEDADNPEDIADDKTSDDEQDIESPEEDKDSSDKSEASDASREDEGNQGVDKEETVESAENPDPDDIATDEDAQEAKPDNKDGENPDSPVTDKQDNSGPDKESVKPIKDSDKGDFSDIAAFASEQGADKAEKDDDNQEVSSDDFSADSDITEAIEHSEPKQEEKEDSEIDHDEKDEEDDISQSTFDDVVDAFSDFLDDMATDPNLSFDDFLNQEFDPSGQISTQTMAEAIGDLLADNESPIPEMESALADYIQGIDIDAPEGADAVSQAVSIGIDLTSIGDNDVDNHIDPIESLETISAGVDEAVADTIFDGVSSFIESFGEQAETGLQDFASEDMSWIDDLQTSDFVEPDFVDQLVNDLETLSVDNALDTMALTENNGVDVLNDAIAAQELQESDPVIEIDPGDFQQNESPVDQSAQTNNDLQVDDTNSSKVDTKDDTNEGVDVAGDLQQPVDYEFDERDFESY